MPRLNQIIAIANTSKSDCTKAVTEIYHDLQKPDLFTGFERKYQPLDDEGEVLPPEKKIIQKNVINQLEVAKGKLIGMFDVIATQEYGNCEARADIKVGDTVVAPKVPVSYLLFLEKQMDNIATLVAKCPTLPVDVAWNKSSTNNVYIADPVVTTRTKKIPKAFVRAAATDKHPAQVDVFNEDVVVGKWTKTDVSTAIPTSDRDKLLERITALKNAIKMAREEANSMEVKAVQIGKAITDYAFGV